MSVLKGVVVGSWQLAVGNWTLFFALLGKIFSAKWQVVFNSESRRTEDCLMPTANCEVHFSKPQI